MSKKINFHPIASQIHIGRRDLQEDAMAFGENFMLVSDGVGGLSKGEVASQIVAETWQSILDHSQSWHEIPDDQIMEWISETVARMNVFVLSNPACADMAATLACVILLGDHAVCIHVGDSRIYHFSASGALKWRSRDHSLVQELVSSGIISEEDAASYPHRNIINRVLQANSNRPANPDVHRIFPVNEGDYFMVCTDGVLESWSDQTLSALFSDHADIRHIADMIGAECSNQSRDNNTLVIGVVRSSSL